jgi:hypothetical protein
MKYCRVDLSKTNYSIQPGAWILSMIEREDRIAYMRDIYAEYCRHKEFESVVPLFDSIFYDRNNDVIGYTNWDKFVAFSIVKKHDKENVESLQFAWNYSTPSARLGIKSIEHECAWYKRLGFKYLYLGLADEYKKQFDGYEELGPI